MTQCTSLRTVLQNTHWVLLEPSQCMSVPNCQFNNTHGRVHDNTDQSTQVYHSLRTSLPGTRRTRFPQRQLPSLDLHAENDKRTLPVSDCMGYCSRGYRIHCSVTSHQGRDLVVSQKIQVINTMRTNEIRCTSPIVPIHVHYLLNLKGERIFGKRMLSTSTRK